MEKKIIITIREDGSMSFESDKRIPATEMLGVLRYYEKWVWLKMVSNQDKKDKKSKPK